MLLWIFCSCAPLRHVHLCGSLIDFLLRAVLLGDFQLADSQVPKTPNHDAGEGEAEVRSEDDYGTAASRERGGAGHGGLAGAAHAAALVGVGEPAGYRGLSLFLSFSRCSS